MRYEPKNLEMESEEYRESLGFLGRSHNVVFTEDQTDVFYKSAYNAMTNSVNKFEGVDEPPVGGGEEVDEMMSD